MSDLPPAPGFVDAPAGIDVRIDATVACVGEVDWLDAATGDVTLTEAGLVASGPDAMPVPTTGLSLLSGVPSAGSP